MSEDYRADFVREIEIALTLQYNDMEIVNNVTNTIVKTLEHYKIEEKIPTILLEHVNENEKILQQYRACLLIAGKSPKTIYQYVRTCKKLSEIIPKIFTEMNVYDIRLFFQKEMERNISARSRENTRANLSAFFQWMKNEKLILENPIATFKPIKYVDEVKQAFSDIEIDTLRLACKNKKERALIQMLLSTGIRVSELTEMKVKDVNQNTLAVHVANGKGFKERTTYATPVAIKHLIDYLNTRFQQDGEMLFYNKNHDPLGPDGVRYILNSIGKRANVENVHPHRFRRTFATNLSKRGMGIQEIQQLMGYANINTTMEYIAIDDTIIHASYRVHAI